MIFTKLLERIPFTQGPWERIVLNVLWYFIEIHLLDEIDQKSFTLKNTNGETKTI